MWEMSPDEANEWLVEKFGDVMLDQDQTWAMAKETDDVDAIVAFHRLGKGLVARNPLCPPAILRARVEMNERVDLWGVATSPNIDEACALSIMAGDHPFDASQAMDQVRWQLLKNPAAPMETLVSLYNGERGLDSEALAQNSSLPSDAFEPLTRHKRSTVRAAAFANPSVPDHLLDEAVKREASVGARTAIAGSARLSGDSLELMIDRTMKKWHPRVAHALARREDVSVERKLALLTHFDGTGSREIEGTLGMFRASAVSPADMRHLMTVSHGDMAYFTRRELEREAEGRMLELTGVDPRNETARAHLQQTYGNEWWNFTPESPEILFTLATRANL